MKLWLKRKKNGLKQKKSSSLIISTLSDLFFSFYPHTHLHFLSKNSTLNSSHLNSTEPIIKPNRIRPTMDGFTSSVVFRSFVEFVCFSSLLFKVNGLKWINFKLMSLDRKSKSNGWNFPTKKKTTKPKRNWTNKTNKQKQDDQMRVVVQWRWKRGKKNDEKKSI